jgi:DNA invertase Pin-like site-specific DNA recombinase
MIYGYIRVSSDKQTVENQRFEISRFCDSNGLTIDGWIEETISGTRNYDKRKLEELLRNIKAGDAIICSELSRLGRSLYMVMEILALCMEKECRVWTIKDNFRLGDDIQSKVLAFAFGLSAEIERNLISQRTKEALARKKAEGVHLGRPKGALGEHTKLSDKEDVIRCLLDCGNTYAAIARALKVGPLHIGPVLRCAWDKMARKLQQHSDIDDYVAFYDGVSCTFSHFACQRPSLTTALQTPG